MCSMITDLQYIERVRPYVGRFKPHGGERWNFRCPYCGDSKKENKARGWLYRKDDKILYNCFNCSVSTTLGKLLEYLDLQLYKEYRMSYYREDQSFKSSNIELDSDDLDLDDLTDFFKSTTKSLPIYDSALDKLVPISSLPVDHYVVKYIQSRKIPKNLWHLFYFTTKFKKYTNDLKPGKFDTLDRDHPRLVLPYFNEHGRMFAFAGRALNGEEPKYFTIKLIEEEEKIYGRERLDYSKPIIVVEGQIDAVLLPNAISVSGSSFDTPFIRGISTNAILVPDNEPRNPQIVKLYKKYIASGFRVCMLPETFLHKDINDAVIAGLTSNDILQIIHENSYQGLEAELKFISWQKCNYNAKVKQSNSVSSLSDALLNSSLFI